MIQTIFALSVVLFGVTALALVALVIYAVIHGASWFFSSLD